MGGQWTQIRHLPRHTDAEINARVWIVFGGKLQISGANRAGFDQDFEVSVEVSKPLHRMNILFVKGESDRFQPDFGQIFSLTNRS